MFLVANRDLHTIQPVKICLLMQRFNLKVASLSHLCLMFFALAQERLTWSVTESSKGYNAVYFCQAT